MNTDEHRSMLINTDKTKIDYIFLIFYQQLSESIGVLLF